MKLIRKIIFMCFVMFLVSCSSSPQKSIIGKWEMPDNPAATWEFFEDGTFMFVNKYGTNVDGAYNFVDENRMKLEFSELVNAYGPFMVQISIGDDMLTITYEAFGEETFYYIRAK